MAVTNIETFQTVAINPDTTANYGDTLSFPANTLEQSVTIVVSG